jgi:hypothetical protein
MATAGNQEPGIIGPPDQEFSVWGPAEDGGYGVDGYGEQFTALAPWTLAQATELARILNLVHGQFMGPDGHLTESGWSVIHFILSNIPEGGWVF